MNSVDCSIIIVSYNTAGLTLQCLASVYNSFKGQYRYEVIVVDNASKDDSLMQIEARFPQCQLMVNTENLGFAKANNQAIAVAKGQYFLLLNSDTIVPSGAIDDSVVFLQAHPDAGVVGCRLRYPDGSHQHSLARLPTLGNVFDTHVRGKMTAWYSEAEYESSMEVGCVIGAFLLVSRQAVEKVGLLDNRFFMYSEDVDWCKRMWDARLRVLYFSGASVIHIGRQSIKTRKGRMMGWELHKNIVTYFNKHHGIFSATIVTAIISLGLVRTGLIAVKKRLA